MLESTISGSSAILEGAGAALEAIPAVLERIGTRVNDPRSQAIMTGLSVVAIGGIALWAAGMIAAPYIEGAMTSAYGAASDVATQAYGWASSLVTPAPTETVIDGTATEIQEEAPASV